MTTANFWDFLTRSPPCPHLDLIYTIKFTQPPLFHLLFRDPLPAQTIICTCPLGGRLCAIPVCPPKGPTHSLTHLGGRLSFAGDTLERDLSVLDDLLDGAPDDFGVVGRCQNGEDGVVRPELVGRRLALVHGVVAEANPPDLEVEVA